MSLPLFSYLLKPIFIVFRDATILFKIIYYIEDICLFQCKIEIYFVATSENVKAGVHESNII